MSYHNIVVTDADGSVVPMTDDLRKAAIAKLNEWTTDSSWFQDKVNDHFDGPDEPDYEDKWDREAHGDDRDW